MAESDVESNASANATGAAAASSKAKKDAEDKEKAKQAKKDAEDKEKAKQAKKEQQQQEKKEKRAKLMKKIQKLMNEDPDFEKEISKKILKVGHPYLDFFRSRQPVLATLPLCRLFGEYGSVASSLGPFSFWREPVAILRHAQDVGSTNTFGPPCVYHPNIWVICTSGARVLAPLGLLQR